MPRAKRHYVPDQIWHITQRCHKREFLLKFKQDRKRWVQWLFEAKRRFGLVVLNYVVTSNHIHLIVKDDNDFNIIPQAVGLIAGRTAQEYNRRKRRKGAFWEDRYHSTAIENGEHLLRCLVYVDLNMVRAGVVDHPSKWPYGGYNEIQMPRRKNIIIAYEKLRALAGFEDYASFASAHRKWVHAALEDFDAKRDSRWTQSIAVGTGPFIERIKNAMGAMASGRCIRPAKGAFELRETQSSYNSIFDPKNRDIEPK
ncbi:transposase [uncultured Desulfosarcina sp.]|uniref:transposase n=1 Tax=uncultured Desulfosarcina sp. TaxID=218289 RepID=UPI0029C8451A|nr:transposase [uncultured Desulfosarcina sp.]